MRIRADRVKVMVPATTVDFGPTHGALAMALGTADVVTIRAVAGTSRVRIIDQTPTDTPEYWLADHEVEAHPTIAAIRAVLDAVGAPQIGIHLTYRQKIPVGVGLGDLEAQTLAGIYGAWTILGKPQRLTEAALVALAVKRGGDEARLLAALEAQLVLKLPTTPGVADPDYPESYLTFAVGPRVDPVALVPGFTASETHSPELLPRGTSFRRSMANAARASAIIPLLTDSGIGGHGAPEAGGEYPSEDEASTTWQSMMVRVTTDEVLEDHRESFSPASVALIHWLRSRGYATFLSGAGPAVICLWPLSKEVREAVEQSGWTVLGLGVSSEGLVLDV
ncbi:hypothetical protein [Actinomyces minihominis]|uniref:hypothetical protein n=1 Tax=Actinomyces minihominis TaxID=2002838 RepID=UPI000C07E9B1|nr:hypothetical protein [Actinomyces minihominis]